MKSGGPSTHEQFIAAIRPWAESLLAVANAGYHSSFEGERKGRLPPAANSDAMAELAVQHAYAGAWDSHPVDTAMSHIGLLLTAGEDAMLTFAELIVADRTPIYSYVPMARAAMESLALAHWLGEPGIGAKERVRRSLNERIASAYEQSRLPEGMNPEPNRRDRLLMAKTIGYTVTKSRKGHLKVLGADRPSITAHVQRLLGGERLGSVLYSYTSAIAHGTLWGLAARAEPLDPGSPGPVVTAGLIISSDDIAMLAIALLLGHDRSFGGYQRHMGWDLPGLGEAQARASALVGRHLAAVAQR